MFSNNKFRRSGIAVAAQNRYNTGQALGQYCAAHFGPDALGVPNFCHQAVQLLCPLLPPDPQPQALELGCAVGRGAFELAHHFSRVIAMDQSRPFIELARRLQKKGQARYSICEEGDLLRQCHIDLHQLNLADCAHRVHFTLGDACNPPVDEGSCDLVLSLNLLDRLPDPANFLRHIHRPLRIGGLLALASPYQWLESYTPKQKWLGGGAGYGVEQRSSHALTKRLSKHFTRAAKSIDVEYVLRETARNYLHGISELSFWRRCG